MVVKFTEIQTAREGLVLNLLHKEERLTKERSVQICYGAQDQSKDSRSVYGEGRNKSSELSGQDCRERKVLFGAGLEGGSLGEEAMKPTAGVRKGEEVFRGGL